VVPASTMEVVEEFTTSMAMWSNLLQLLLSLVVSVVPEEVVYMKQAPGFVDSSKPHYHAASASYWHLYNMQPRPLKRGRTR
jgi:hypothetical protein